MRGWGLGGRIAFSIMIPVHRQLPPSSLGPGQPHAARAERRRRPGGQAELRESDRRSRAGRHAGAELEFFRGFNVYNFVAALRLRLSVAAGGPVRRPAGRPEIAGPVLRRPGLRSTKTDNESTPSMAAAVPRQSPGRNSRILAIRNVPSLPSLKIHREDDVNLNFQV